MLRKTAFIQNLETAPESPLEIGFDRCAENPDIINIGTAENHIMNDWLIPKLSDWSDFTPDRLLYSGTDWYQFMVDLASFYREHLGIADAKPEHLIPTIGIAFLVEHIGLILCEPGDIVLIPKPCYGCFEPDIHSSRCVVQYIDLDNLPPAPPEKARMLLLTNPGNPYGDIIPNQDKILRWALSNPNLHVVTDDVYALSNRRGEKFVSIAGRSDIDPMRVHQFYGLSKDWGLAGFHVGFFFTRNKEMMKYMLKARTTSYISSDTVYLSHKLFKDHKWRDDFIVEFKKRLIKQEKFALLKLKEANIPVRECDNSLFVMIDLTDIAGTDESEMKVYTRLLDDYKVHILPGKAGFFCEKPGWFRLCFSLEDEPLRIALERLAKGVKEMRAELHN